MNFNTIKNITIPEGSVVKITDPNGIVLWQKESEPIVTTATPMYFENVDSVPVEICIYADDMFNNPVTLETSTDGDVWEIWGTTYEEGSLVRQVQVGEKLYIRATENVGTFNTTGWDNLFKSTGNVNVGGNIMSLIYKDFKDKTILTTTNTFFHLFYNMSTLLSVKDLLLPATQLTDYCYAGMFKGCTSLAEAPSLPATQLEKQCYREMFIGCTSLTKTPSTLPATELTDYCYASMFRGCSSLTEAPALPATQLADYCYIQMFYGCTNLNKVTTYATDISASVALDQWLYDVSPTGDFYNLGSATYPSGSSGIPSGWTEHKTLE